MQGFATGTPPCGSVPVLIQHSYLEGDGIANELGVFLDNFFDSLLLEVLSLVLLHVQNDVGATPNGFHVLITSHSERTTSRRLPQILLVIIVLCVCE